MKVSMSTKIDIRHDSTAGELARFFASLPAGAKISVTKEKYYDQRDPGSTYITATWSQEQ